MTNWSELPSDLLALIAKRLVCMEHFLAFGAVCTSWLLAADKNNFEPSQLQPPWLMLGKMKNKTFREFLSLTTHKIYRFPIRDANGKKCLASQGWLFAIGKNLDINLVHPLSGARVPLPQMHTLKDSDRLFDCPGFHFIYKAILSANNPNDLRVAIFYGNGINKVAFCKVGEETWKTVEAYPSCACHDLLYYKGQFFGVDILARIWVFNHENLNAQVISTIPSEFLANHGNSMIRKPWQYFERFYLVESAGSLLAVSREGKICGHDYGTTGFRVFELDVEDGMWKRVNSLGNRALFLGHNSSFSIQVTSNSGCKADCIYFTDDYYCFSSYQESHRRKGKDQGIYNMGDHGSFEQHFRGETHHCDNPSIWIEPTFCRVKSR
ncbi:F-box protein At2g26160-like [Durio zibethinus]|uniref:F-box protein At2g26160-like n=1 Tax=Durio zibethinus TaxID=66656 RepID=A0A6P6B8C5_DURZI|nr:F-box protein At2g26160-like [Durio zibethinus]